ncbi:hypothetical protein [Streptomyces coeruleorubidus]|uniref:hypothetical protein n=1 Tax=Streptomyces coeruleorubidus TaxID=116188 RepID=UPI0033A1AC41
MRAKEEKCTAGCGSGASVQRLALFDLDGTLVDRRLAFSAWAAEFAGERQLGGQAAGWLVAADRQGAVPRDQFFREVRKRFGLAEAAEESGSSSWPPSGAVWR